MKNEAEGARDEYTHEKVDESKKFAAIGQFSDSSFVCVNAKNVRFQHVCTLRVHCCNGLCVYIGVSSLLTERLLVCCCRRLSAVRSVWYSAAH